MRPVQQLFPSANFRTYGLYRYKHYNKTDDEKMRFALADQREMSCGRARGYNWTDDTIRYKYRNKRQQIRIKKSAIKTENLKNRRPVNNNTEQLCH